MYKANRTEKTSARGRKCKKRRDGVGQRRRNGPEAAQRRRRRRKGSDRQRGGRQRVADSSKGPSKQAGENFKFQRVGDLMRTPPSPPPSAPHCSRGVPHCSRTFPSFPSVSLVPHKFPLFPEYSVQTYLVS